MEIAPPVWLLVSWWTSKSASNHNLIVPNPTDSRVSTRYQVLWKHFRTRTSFLPLSSFGYLTLVVRIVNLVIWLGIARLLKKRSFAMSVWKVCVSLYVFLECIAGLLIDILSSQFLPFHVFSNLASRPNNQGNLLCGQQRRTLFCIVRLVEQ